MPRPEPLTPCWPGGARLASSLWPEEVQEARKTHLSWGVGGRLGEKGLAGLKLCLERLGQPRRATPTCHMTNTGAVELLEPQEYIHKPHDIKERYFV